MTRLVGLFGIVMLVLAFVLSSSSPVTADEGNSRLLTARLTGAAEVPGPADPDGAGQAWIILLPQQGQVCFTITVERVDPLTMAHIHFAPRGVAGAVVVPLTPLAATGASAGCVSADRQLIRAIRDHPSAYYVNVHNAPFPAGALRGQLHTLSN
jgi:hypothetical protein